MANGANCGIKRRELIKWHQMNSKKRRVFYEFPVCIINYVLAVPTSALVVLRWYWHDLRKGFGLVHFDRFFQNQCHSLLHSHCHFAAVFPIVVAILGPIPIPPSWVVAVTASVIWAMRQAKERADGLAHWKPRDSHKKWNKLKWVLRLSTATLLDLSIIENTAAILWFLLRICVWIWILIKWIFCPWLLGSWSLN